MSHKGVETVIGKLVTDERFRRQFFADPAAALDEVRRWGCEVTAVEMEALLTLDAEALKGLADGIDARLQKADLGAADGKDESCKALSTS